MQNFRKIMFHFMMMWLLTAAGLFVGTLLPPAIIMPISILTIVLIIISIFIRSLRLMNTILYAIPFLVGITLFWSTQFYINKLGEELVFAVFIGTILIFVLLAIIGICLPDLSPIGNYLLGILIVVFLFSLIFIFVPVSNMIMLILAAVTVLLFVVYTVYDFNQIKHNHVSDHETVSMALNLYLDFINLFINILEIIWRLKDEA